MNEGHCVFFESNLRVTVFAQAVVLEMMTIEVLVLIFLLTHNG